MSVQNKSPKQEAAKRGKKTNVSKNRKQESFQHACSKNEKKNKKKTTTTKKTTITTTTTKKIAAGKGRCCFSLINAAQSF